jgi:hypothetical protein
MNLRHAAALALVGWYLMVPPTPWNPKISTWTIWNSYDTAAQCGIVLGRQRESASRVLADMAALAKHKPTNKFQAEVDAVTLDPKFKAMEEAELNAACISSDDPRLK